MLQELVQDVKFGKWGSESVCVGGPSSSDASPVPSEVSCHIRIPKSAKEENRTPSWKAEVVCWEFPSVVEVPEEEVKLQGRNRERLKVKNS